ncbi:MAG TPA: hypothetical protein VFV67_15325 [Actinophytocola sp.]|uniref:hypothetical protein n=1 Tax=Actinophytocola sp. TaxID=1872138 RepID=UPI002DBAA169|nr:hypothetical protein [Actinophytocola sp.]HEU5472022.1 hypothetical protein [Actinophytocola sp.]
MAVGKRLAGVLPLAGASVAAMALAGVAVFTVTSAGCAEAGRYVQDQDGTVRLVGSCLDPAELPAAPVQHVPDPRPAEPASNELGQINP